MKQAKCLNPSCENTAATRGLCCHCYQAAYREVKAKRSTWAKLVAAKKCLPAQEQLEWLRSR